MKVILFSFILNIVLFTSISASFYYLYGWITDDVIYYHRYQQFIGNFFQISNGNEFMWFITRYIRYFDLEINSMHALFAGVGFMGSLNYLKVSSYFVDFKSKFDQGSKKIIILTFLCFPNFIAWGRFYGKDSLMFYMSSVYCYYMYHIITEKKIKIKHIAVNCVMLFLMYKLRSHIAGVFIIGMALGIWFKMLTINKKTFGPRHLFYRIIFPGLIVCMSFFILVNVFRGVTKTENVSIETIQGSLVSASKMGAVGGSTTAYADNLYDNPTVIFTPKQIAQNFFNVFFAPLPWQIRSGADILAFVSNVLLVGLIYRFRKNLTFDNAFKKYLLVVITLLVFLLSFMSANVGLILRQKTIVLPFIFAYLFFATRKQDESSALSLS